MLELGDEPMLRAGEGFERRLRAIMTRGGLGSNAARRPGASIISEHSPEATP
jgi:hypothetical protein